jgi:hypothetical protein
MVQQQFLTDAACMTPASPSTPRRRERQRPDDLASNHTRNSPFRPATDGRADAHAPAAHAAETAVDHVLELIEHSRLSAQELRILLALVDREATDLELAEASGWASWEIRRTAARLYGRGLLRWRDDIKRRAAIFGITPPGLAMVRPLVAATKSDSRA